ncbi:MAG: type 1 glutamine amidotransferase [Candidatus Bipolaricaulota bacterium]
MAPRILVVDNSLYPHLFPLARRWARALAEHGDVEILRAPQATSLPEIRQFTHLVLTGSEASVLRPTPWMQREAEMLRAARDTDTRVLGSCFGHELLVWALSGPRYLARAARPEVGRISVELREQDELLSGLPNPWSVFAFHLVEVVDPPSPWRVLATSRRCATHVLRYGRAPIWGVQAHPEITRRSSEFAMRSHLLWTQRRGGVPRSTWRRPVGGPQALAALVAAFVGEAPSIR